MTTPTNKAVREALEYAGTIIKFCVKPEKCVTRGDIAAGTDIMKSALEIYQSIQEALSLLDAETAGVGGDGTPLVGAWPCSGRVGDRRLVGDV